MIRNNVNKSTKWVMQRILSKDLLMQSKWCKFIVENENNQKGNQNNNANNILKKNANHNKRKMPNANDNNSVNFDNDASKLIDNYIEVLSPLNDAPNACAQAVAQSQYVIETKRKRKNKNTITLVIITMRLIIEIHNREACYINQDLNKILFTEIMIMSIIN